MVDKPEVIDGPRITGNVKARSEGDRARTPHRTHSINNVSLLKNQVNVKGSFDVGIRFNSFSYFLKILTVEEPSLPETLTSR